MPEMSDQAAASMADHLHVIAADLNLTAHTIRGEGWHVSAQQVRNAVQLLRDVERRLRNGDDWSG